MWYISNSFWAAQSPLCRWRILTLIDWFCGCCGESRIERVTGDVNSMMPQKSGGLQPRCPCALELLSCRQMKKLTASLWLCTPGVDLLSECVSSPPRALQWSSTASFWLWRLGNGPDIPAQRRRPNVWRARRWNDGFVCKEPKRVTSANPHALGR